VATFTHYASFGDPCVGGGEIGRQHFTVTYIQGGTAQWTMDMKAHGTMVFSIMHAFTNAFIGVDFAGTIHTARHVSSKATHNTPFPRGPFVNENVGPGVLADCTIIL
jgi:hypothetical protein